MAVVLHAAVDPLEGLESPITDSIRRSGGAGDRISKFSQAAYRTIPRDSMWGKLH